ncbi:Cadmium-induced protein CadI [Paraburkholderia aspalathi]|uniref:ArsI/CadI family heavy metal resistance metalloenzyme n=1 Tax=Paraburkholderia aspalathi TaxID=1324617 RepID=UPI00190BE16C|nr:ArsI/CadI family heavy metal resistance metalloenzyme [Paraburkholderia aspalathi]MBK3842428.1 glyoxalase/bleomycin resistance/dioxygenase family protein [Paraburkholderia aspalathi]CAE6831005.1 Cadmium-induced protein CadI [Paraburkholderia aspalathi]
MKRMHIHVAVADLESSTRFYTAMFGGVEPTVAKSDYRKWELADPKVNFAISQRGVQPGIDHLGIQVETDEELAEMRERFASVELPVTNQTATSCCYAKSDKTWTVDPQGVAWETFRTLEQALVYGESRDRSRTASISPVACCAGSDSKRSST